jgi:hypothetical protein
MILFSISARLFTQNQIYDIFRLVQLFTICLNLDVPKRRTRRADLAKKPALY